MTGYRLIAANEDRAREQARRYFEIEIERVDCDRFAVRVVLILSAAFAAAVVAL